MTRPKIVILGPQGAGKGTQASLLARHWHIPHISTGEVLRREMARGTSLGNRIKKTMNAGSMVNDHDTNKIMRQRLAKRDCGNGWISDGYPRRVEQARQAIHFAKPSVIILLKLTDADAIKRLAGRRVCPRGHIYHLQYDRPKKRRGYCDHDGLKLMMRADDTPAAIRKRLRWHRAETEPMIRWFRNRVPIVTVDARPPISAVYRSILNELNAFPWPSSPTRKISRA